MRNVAVVVRDQNDPARPATRKRPIQGATVKIQGSRAAAVTTNARGVALLRSVPAGQQVLILGGTASEVRRPIRVIAGAGTQTIDPISVPRRPARSPAPPISVPARFTLTVRLAGSGAGVVASSPSGIACPSDCEESYPTGTEVLIGARPLSGYVFTGWGGTCATVGTSDCLLTMTGNAAVITTFEPAAPGPPSRPTEAVGLLQDLGGDRYLIERRLGYRYVIELGVGCLSAWRYVGYTVHIYSPGLFAGVGSRLILPDGAGECSIWSAREV